MQRKLLLGFFFILLLSITMANGAVTTSSQNVTAAPLPTDKATVYVDPQYIVDHSKLSGTFNVTIRIYNVSKLYGFQLQLKWDPTVLEVVAKTVKAPVEKWPDGVLYTDTRLPPPGVFIIDTLSNPAGTWSVAVASTAITPVDKTPKTWGGTGTLAEIKFNVKGEGWSPINLGVPNPPTPLPEAYTKLVGAEVPYPGARPIQFAIPHYVQSGIFGNNFHNVAVASVTPSTRETFINQPVSIDVTAENRGSFTETFNVTAYYQSEVGTVDIDLFANATQGWGITRGNIISPGPTLSVKKGDTINLTLTSVDGLAHNFFVDYNNDTLPSADEPKSSNFSTTINYNFTANTNGTFTYFCQHHNSTMFGNFSVVEPSTSGIEIGREQTTLTSKFLEPPGSATFAFNWNTSGIPLGHYTIIAEADTVPGEKEADKTDNILIAHRIIEITLKISHDISILVSKPFSVPVGEIVALNVSVKNVGNIFENNLNVTAAYANVTRPYDAIPLASYTIPVLDTGATNTTAVKWNTTGLTLGTYRISANVSVVANETNTINNAFVGNVMVSLVPVASFTYTRSNHLSVFVLFATRDSTSDLIAGDTSIFNASASYDPDPGGNITSYTWNFGDGNATTAKTPIVPHVYKESGEYTVTLTVQDKARLVRSVTQKLKVIKVEWYTSYIYAGGVAAGAIALTMVTYKMKLRNRPPKRNGASLPENPNA